MLAENETDSDEHEGQGLKHDPLLDSYTEGFRASVTRKYSALHPGLKTLVKFALLMAIPVRFVFQGNMIGLELIFASFSFSVFSLSWEAHFYEIYRVFIFAVILSLPSLAISYLRDKNPKRDIPLKYTVLAVLLTPILAIMVPFILWLLRPRWQALQIGSPTIGLVGGSSFGILPLLFLVVLPQIMQWVESLPTDGVSLEQADDKSLNADRLSYLMFILLFFVPFMGVLLAGPYNQSLGISFMSLFLMIDLEYSLMPLEIMIPPLFTMFFSSLLGIPRLFFAYRLIKFIYGLETRKRALRMGILSVAWSLLGFSIMDLLMYSPGIPFLIVPIPSPILFIFGAIALHRPAKFSFLVTEEIPMERITKPREETREWPEEITVPVTYVLKSKLITSRFNIWNDREDQERAAA
ncbi:MAG: hypothetical protein KGY80_10875 [Candidatus Thorarchaeota archaeon]|nr:hypothetical protein [Candidatus Thorarchaeota archaeon]